jgi:hypothetical protein
MAIYNYYGTNLVVPTPSIPDTYYARTFNAPINVLTTPQSSNLADEIGTPDDILKLSPGISYGTNESITFILDYPLTIESLTVGDWDLVLKEKWFKAWMTKVGLSNFISQPVFYDLFNAWEELLGFEKLSGLSIATMFQDITTFEVSIMVNIYESTFFRDWIFANQSPIASLLNGSLIPGKHYISHVGKVTYGNHTDYVWSFSSKPFIFNQYTIANDFVNGGGNIFALIKLAGANYKENISVVKPHYLIVKNVPKNDPTKGFSTSNRKIDNEFPEIAYLGPFCIGDVLTILNNSSITSRTNLTNTFQWTWFGDLSNIPTIWYIADVTNPCEDYRTVPVYDMLFPIRVISECKIEDFD